MDRMALMMFVLAATVLGWACWNLVQAAAAAAPAPY